MPKPAAQTPSSAITWADRDGRRGWCAGSSPAHPIGGMSSFSRENRTK